MEKRVVQDFPVAQGLTLCGGCKQFIGADREYLSPQPSVTVVMTSAGQIETVDGKVFSHGHCPVCAQLELMKWKMACRGETGIEASLPEGDRD